MKKLIFSLILAAMVMPYLHAQECQQTATATVTLTQRKLTDEEKQVTCGETFESEIAFYRVTPGALPGIFTVSEDKTGKKTYVRFSSGNLQYLPASINGDSVWRFAPHQYDFIGGADSKGNHTYGGTANTYSIGNQYKTQAYSHAEVVINTENKQADEQWFDLFHFGTSGYGTYHPLKNSCPGGNHTLNENTDWGRYNKIFMGGDQQGLWRTMGYNEWDYLINSRKASDNQTSLYGRGCIEVEKGKYVNGLFLFPDGFADIDDPDTLNSTLVTKRGTCAYTANKFTLTQFAALEKVGVVFLPAAGYIQNNQSQPVQNINSHGRYHAKENSGGSSNAYHLLFSGSEITTKRSDDDKYIFAYSVRLVQNFEKH